MTTASRNRVLLGAALVILLVLAGALVAGRGGGEARASSLSRGPGGWLATRRYLQARGAHVTLLDRPLDYVEGTGVLVSAFPWQQGLSMELAEPLENHLRRGGTLVLAYSGSFGNAAEMLTLEALGLRLEEKRKPVLNPFRWRKFAREEWDLRPGPGVKAAAAVRVWAPRWGPELPRKSTVLFQTPSGEPAVVVIDRFRRHPGQLWVLPADALANARLGNPGNAALLETMLQRLGRRWIFDEYHHGLISGPTVETVAFGRTLDLILLHLAVLYLAGLLTLARRFGPPWSELPVVTGSAESFLLGLGALHHRLGHHREATLQLIERARELDRNLVIPEALERRAANAGPEELVALAQEVARLRTGPSRAEEADIVMDRENAA
ncbi:MAG TPA: DUF4350 domain-containing protein [Thermoanaerobaculia bacterium]|nr:DUF4350 domain-containing protein [Thermoanaerobaculia bacterium]